MTNGPMQAFTDQAHHRLAMLGTADLPVSLLESAAAKLALILDGLAGVDGLGIEEAEPAPIYRPGEVLRGAG